ncbi:ribonuclease P protein component [Brumimicrobium salinarum]|uniref:Ribonuclease P protein component n=1 Tax=Brumimicrobium salinarum TaxID=2058658 RepID=A0A2I0QZG8_9FLAO|nr:ribonuclease P protein component [Brumimicrobium salinarum]PKR79734.1 ribonuclease P protein component [Brumimicrobium salinarum]
MTKNNERFGKPYKLCSKTVISNVFAAGKVEKKYPFLIRYHYAALNTDEAFQVMISVPKRKFKKAVDRNRIKRLIKEAVRKRKYIFEENLIAKNQQMAIVIIYTGNQEESYHSILNKIEALFLRLDQRESA